MMLVSAAVKYSSLWTILNALKMYNDKKKFNMYCKIKITTLFKKIVFRAKTKNGGSRKLGGPTILTKFLKK